MQAARVPAAIVWSETASNVASVLIAVAVLALMFPSIRWRLRRIGEEIGYELRMARWRVSVAEARERARRQPAAAWTRDLGAELPDELG